MASKAFRIEVEGVTEWITTDGIEGKLKRMAGGVGLRVLSLQPIDEQEDQDTSIQARLMNWIRDQGGSASVLDVQRAFGFRCAEDAREMLQQLTRTGRGRWISLPSEIPGKSVEAVEIITSGRGLLSGMQGTAASPDETQAV